MKLLRLTSVLVVLSLALMVNGCLCWLTGNCDKTLNGPSSPTPQNLASGQPTTITLAWGGGESPSGRQVTFDLYFGAAYPPGLWQPGLTEKSFLMDSLQEAKTYYWKIIVREKNGSSIEGGIWSFTTIFPPKSLVVDYPNWATNWARGETRSILWRSAYAGSQVKIDLYKSGHLQCHITQATINDGNFEWLLTDCANESDPDYLIRVSSLLDSTLFAESDRFTVTIPCPIQVISPQLRDEWLANESRTIQWKPLGFGTNVKVSLHLYKGSEFIYIVAPVTSDDGTYDWNVSDYGAGSGPDYRIRISDLNEFDCSKFGDFFTIQACSVLVSSPALGDVWPLETTHTIIWDPTYLGQTVSFELYHDGDFVCTLADDVPNTGTYEWVALRCESVFGENFQIRVLSVATGSCGFSGKFKFH